MEFIFSTFQSAFAFMQPYLTNYSEFSRVLSKETQVKEGGNIQYNFDLELDGIFQKKIREFGIGGKIFSEESGWNEWGEKKYRVVCDPFCNSSLASKTFLDAAIGISIFSYDYRFITSAIMDYQTGIVGMIEDGKTNFYQIQTKEKIVFDIPVKDKLEDAWVVIALENRKTREDIDKARHILDKAKRIIINSGHIYWLRLAEGTIDAYLDPFGGEKLYEMFACTVVQKSGCAVTDLDGEEFDPVKYLKIFEDDRDSIYYPVASRHKELHNRILSTLADTHLVRIKGAVIA
ncbi:MAG: hypothetical protein WC022_03515 [Parcubacteria group bacterium]